MFSTDEAVDVTLLCDNCCMKSVVDKFGMKIKTRSVGEEQFRITVKVCAGPTLVDVLDKLSKMEVVEKRTPINDEGNKRKASYHISDPLSAFYYRYIFRYASQRKIMDPSIFYEKYIREDFESFYVPHYFEEIKQVKATGMNCYKYVFVSKSPVDLEGIEETVEVIRLTNLWN